MHVRDLCYELVLSYVRSCMNFDWPETFIQAGFSKKFCKQVSFSGSPLEPYLDNSSPWSSMMLISTLVCSPIVADVSRILPRRTWSNSKVKLSMCLRKPAIRMHMWYPDIHFHMMAVGVGTKTLTEAEMSSNRSSQLVGVCQPGRISNPPGSSSQAYISKYVLSR